MIEKKSANFITANAIRNLSSQTPLNYFGQGSIARTIIEVMATEIETLYDSIDINLSQSRLQTASGVFLDLIAAQFGLTRSNGVSSSILSTDKAVRFYVRDGRLVDFLGYLGNTRGRIPGGTLIYSRDNSIVYEVSEDTFFPANTKSVWVPVRPKDPSLGSRNNVAPGSLSAHSLGNSNIFVENISTLITGSDAETDEELRSRISRAINSSVTGSRSAILQAAFSFPGVSDIRINPYKHGAGSFEILVVPTGSTVSENVLQLIRKSVESVVPFGIRVTVRGPEVVGIGIAMIIDMKEGSLSQTKDLAISRVKESLLRYLGDIPMGGELIINRLRTTALTAHNSIKDVEINRILINCRPQVISNWRLQPDEVFDLDRKLPEPILVI